MLWINLRDAEASSGDVEESDALVALTVTRADKRRYAREVQAVGCGVHIEGSMSDRRVGKGVVTAITKYYYYFRLATTDP